MIIIYIYDVLNVHNLLTVSSHLYFFLTAQHLSNGSRDLVPRESKAKETSFLSRKHGLKSLDANPWEAEDRRANQGGWNFGSKTSHAV